MKKKYFLLVFCILSAFIGPVSADNYPVGANSSAMSNATVMLPGIWSAYHNQAGLSGIDVPTIGLHFSNEYFVKELSVKGFVFAYPTRTGTFGLSFTSFGYSKYNQSKIGLAYSKKLAKTLSVGIQLDYFRTKIGDEYGKSGFASAEIGILSEPTKNLLIGAHLIGVWNSKISDSWTESQPKILRIGVGYRFSPKVTGTTEVMKDFDMEAQYKAGLEFEIVTNLILRTGISLKPIQNSFGVGYRFGGIICDIGFSRHEILGYSSQISIIYGFSRKGKL